MEALGPSSPSRDSSLRFKIQLILLLAILLPVLTLGSFAYTSGRRQTLASELDHLSGKAQELGALVDKYLASNAQLVQHLAATSEAQGFLNDPAKSEAMNAWLRTQIHLGSNLEALFILNAKGDCLASSDPRFLNHNYAFRSYFKDGLAGLSRLTDWQVGLTNPSPCVFIASPLRSEDRIRGLLVLRIAMEPVQRMIAEAGGNGRDALLISREGIVLAHSRPKFIYRTLAPLSAAKRAELAQSRQFMDIPLPSMDLDPRLQGVLAASFDSGKPTHTQYALEGRKRWVALARLNEEPWAVGLAVHEATVLAPSRRLLAWTFAIAAICLALALASGMFFSRQILRPLENLAQTMERFGKGEVDRRACSQSLDEVGRLAINFNQMADQLSAQTQALENRVGNLEEILPICSACKKIRNESGIYESVDTYLSGRTKTQFSNGLCEECAQKLYPEIFPKKKPINP